MNIQIREALKSDKELISAVILAAFGDVQGQEVADLVNDLMNDSSAQPLLSLVATVEDETIGHILFTSAHIKNPQQKINATILAPLAVKPQYQNMGVGGSLINEGLRQLKSASVDLVFVLGHPAYYPKFGFSPAGVKGLNAPYPIPPKDADAWMVQALQPGYIGKVRGQVVCANVLNDPKHWVE